MPFDLKKFKNMEQKEDRYAKQLSRMKQRGLDIKNIDDTVKKALDNLSNSIKSFVIYGDPQSGKTEMMIGLTAKLLDEGYSIVVVLLNDNVELLKQNLNRFARSGLDPTPRNFSEILDPSIKIKEKDWIIFCKKNSKDLQKLIDKIGDEENKVIIDDEGDYATPNSKINKQTQTKINELVGKLIGVNGIYIGVTATPARLDLNNTFNNANDRWIHFPSHENYTGPDIFFPLNLSDKLNFKLNPLPDEYDDPKYLKEALFRFFVKVAYLNLRVNSKEENYSILIHTSGKRVDHSEDYKQVINLLNVLSNKQSKNWDKHIKQIWELANKDWGDDLADKIVEYVITNISKHKVVIMNSDNDRKNNDFNHATDPVSLFTIAIGGNIVSRGVTFKNLLSMFFTRDVKHKMQQDTYIQRARMFGARGKYLKYFELTIPEKLYSDWHKCFVFHRLSLESVKIGNAPIWIEDRRVRAVSSVSIDKTTVAMDSGEMGFEVFQYSEDVERIIQENKDSFYKLEELQSLIGKASLPSYLINFIKNFSPDSDDSLAIHKSVSIEGYNDANHKNISRQKGLIGKRDLELDKHPHAIHHIKVFFNSDNKARVFYRYVNNVKFLKNLKKQSI